ncbi:MAG: NUDIX hydrolase [Acidimicrobiales bacterium]
MASSAASLLRAGRCRPPLDVPHVRCTPKPVRRQLVRTLRPTWTAGSVAIIEHADGRWLFVRPVYREGWALPGGLVDRGEHPADTVRRELHEELGLTVQVTGEPWIILDLVLQRIETVFTISLPPDVDPDTVRVTTAELIDVGWYDPAEPPPLEEETHYVIALAAQVAAGGRRVWIHPEPTNGP